MSILEKIFAHKKQEVAAARQQLSEEQLAVQVNQMAAQVDFKASLQDTSKPAPHLIAEIKYKSPSKGILNQDFDPESLAEIYAENGAAAISVLTDEKYFGGSLNILHTIHGQALGLPLLRKDFIFDRYQLLEARIAGASAVLLIVAMLDDHKLAELIAECQKLSLTALVEVHNKSVLGRALSAGANVIGINNRDLNDFSVNLETSLRLAKLCPADIVLVAESGINSIEDIQRLAEVKIDAILVGEALMTAPDVAAKVRSLAGLNV
jgi:indole-3-glycerol phosphate synthase